MTKHTLKNYAFSLVLLGLALSPSNGQAQVTHRSVTRGKHPVSAGTQATANHKLAAGSPSYTYTLLSFPGFLQTSAGAINLGATTSKTAMVGGFGTDTQSGGFVVEVSGTKIVTETYRAVNYPHSTQQSADGINDLGQIAGVYADASGVYHGYELSGGKFTTLNVPFSGAVDTFSYGINNSGEVVGGWSVSDGFTHGFTLIGGTYTSLDYPGATQTFAFSLNNAGDVVGYYDDTSGVEHGFLLSGGTYTSIDPPGSVLTAVLGINDAGDMVGNYCTTSECVSSPNNEGIQGFLLSGGVFTTIAIPGETSTFLAGINNKGVVSGGYVDAAGLNISFLATP